ncbi:MAG: ABC transporter permease, partial [Clostridiales bacterium]|nr:ABC transporter permease [Clostridiales bacterium]
MKKSKLSSSSKFYIFLILVFLYAPIGVMILFSFNESSSTYVFTNFSLKWWKEMFGNASAMASLENSVLLAVASAAVSTVLGTMAAVGIFNYRSKRIKRAVMTVTNIPM